MINQEEYPIAYKYEEDKPKGLYDAFLNVKVNYSSKVSITLTAVSEGLIANIITTIRPDNTSDEFTVNVKPTAEVKDARQDESE